jgi:penicillin-binding protein 1C
VVKIKNEQPAPNIVFLAFGLLKGFLIVVGKPFYFILSYSLIFLFALFYFFGHLLVLILQLPFLLFKGIRTIVKKIIFEKNRPVKVKKIKVKEFEIKRERKKLRFTFKLHLPKIKFTLPKLHFKVRINTRQISFLLFCLSLFFFIWFLVFKNLPSPRTLVSRESEVSTKIYDRNGELLYKIFKNKNRTPVSLKRIPLTARQATLAAEDAEFYQHLGFSIKGMTRALIKNLRKGTLSGGSTITQQLVKNALLTPEKTILRKIKELILSFEVEMVYSKDQILEMYLNEVSYGGTAYGIEEAAQSYFGKKVEDLNLAEAALLAGLPKSPTKFSPFGANPNASFERQREVLSLMTINKFITEEERVAAVNQSITFNANRIDIKAPHFVMFVKEALVEKYGEEMVQKGGLEVVTTLDFKIQELAEKEVAGEIARLGPLRVTNGAALVLNPTNGEILAMVGSKDYFDLKNDGNVNVTTALRQPGSSIKVVNYAYALSNGYTPASILDDSPVSFSVPGQPVYTPKNYDGKYRGNLTLRSAFAESRNIPAVKVLASYGVNKMIALGTKMGITTWTNPQNYGLSLTLGGGEVKLIDEAIVYSTVANDGQKPELTFIREVKNYKGKILEKESKADQEQIFSPEVAFLLKSILSDNAARSPAFGVNSALVIPNHPEVAVKTGTSNNLKDNLTFGFNQNFLVAVWVGNNDGSPMSQIASGVTGASPIFNRIMTALLKSQPSVAWVKPEGVLSLSICSLTGSLTCEGCPAKYEYFLKGNAPNKICSKEQIEKILEEKQRAEETKKQGQILPEAASVTN